MTEQGNGDNGDATKPPEGVLAEAALKDEEVAKPEPRLVTKPPTTLPVDPSYAEPVPHAKFKSMADAISKGTDPDVQRAEQQTLIKFLLDRVKVLEDALMPFGSSAMVMSNARMCLIADNRPDEPAGGTWFSNVQGIQLQPNEGLYFSACDAIGRQRVHDHTVEVFERLQKMREQQAEKDKHVDDGGTVH
jgi:hypothetical protein